MKKILALAVAAALLGGCFDESRPAAQQPAPEPQIVVKEKLVEVGQKFLKDKVEMADGKLMRFDGYLQQYVMIMDTKNDRLHDRYIVHLNSDRAASYAGINQILTEQGYASEERRNDDERIVTVYRKKGLPAITATFWNANEKYPDQHKSRVTLQWRVK